jgi:hypothetical protein
MMPFSAFWDIYPRRVGKFKAEKIWRKLSESEQQAAIQGVGLWKQTYQWQVGDGMFIPYGSTFLNQRRWEDEPWTGAFAELRA